MRVKLVAVCGVAMLALVVGALAWLGRAPEAVQGDEVGALAGSHGPPLRIGLIPERDIFAQRQRYRALADYLALKLDRPVELLSVNSYQAVLQDFSEQKVDVAFLGSLVTLLTVDRLGTQVMVKPQAADGSSTYRGVIFVPESSPIRSIEDLAGQRLATVRTTTGGNLYPMYELRRRQMLGRDDSPRLVWVGTHDQVIAEVLAGNADAGALKDLRLMEFVRLHPDRPLRILGRSESVPDNALVVRADLAEGLGREVADLLLGMHEDPRGRMALTAFGAQRFVPCSLLEYRPICRMVRELGEAWSELGVSGPPPCRRPATAMECD